MEKERQFHNSDLTLRAKELRNAPTKEEKKLWFDFLKTLPVHFCRQKVIGHYIVDFYCAQHKLVIELDGSQHYEDKGEEYDKRRDAHLAQNTDFSAEEIAKKSLKIASEICVYTNDHIICETV